MHRNSFPVGKISVFLVGVIVGLAGFLAGAFSNSPRPILGHLKAPPAEWITAYGTESAERLYFVYNLADLRNEVQIQARKLAALEAKANPPTEPKSAKPADPNAAKLKGK